ncbi:5-oxoprolinase subunit PxpA [Escherichia coli]|nr:5-oxoprolinase subunit PxpA [Escherichia coli]
MLRSIDISSDMGESFGAWTLGDIRDIDIMPYISSANIATGFHAGDPGIMHRTIISARDSGVSVGAHPGYRDLAGFGRRHIHCAAEEITNDMIYQLGALREFATLHNVPVNHVKPHGALYMHLAHDRDAAKHFVSTLHSYAPELRIYCMYGSAIWKEATQIGHPVICEFYADRDYDQSGSIVFIRRTEPLNPDDVAKKVLRACLEGKVRTVEDQDIDIHFSSVCVHSDTPGALSLLIAINKALREADISVNSQN